MSKYTVLRKNAKARLRELATVAGGNKDTGSRNLVFTFYLKTVNLKIISNWMRPAQLFSQHEILIRPSFSVHSTHCTPAEGEKPTSFPPPSVINRRQSSNHHFSSVNERVQRSQKYMFRFREGIFLYSAAEWAKKLAQYQKSHIIAPW